MISCNYGSVRFKNIGVPEEARVRDIQGDIDLWTCYNFDYFLGEGHSGDRSLISLRPPTPEELSVLLEVASAVLAGIVVLFHLSKKSLRATNAITILARAAGLAILPQALLIMYATFDPSVLCGVQGLRVFFMLSGLSLVYVCVRSVTS